MDGANSASQSPPGFSNDGQDRIFRRSKYCSDVRAWRSHCDFSLSCGPNARCQDPEPPVRNGKQNRMAQSAKNFATKMKKMQAELSLAVRAFPRSSDFGPSKRRKTRSATWSHFGRCPESARAFASAHRDKSTQS
jgi:hypothetical protein